MGVTLISCALCLTLVVSEGRFCSIPCAEEYARESERLRSEATYGHLQAMDDARHLDTCPYCFDSELTGLERRESCRLHNLFRGDLNAQSHVVDAL